MLNVAWGPIWTLHYHNFSIILILGVQYGPTYHKTLSFEEKHILSLSHYGVTAICFDWQSRSVKCELPEQHSELVTDHSSASQCEEKWWFSRESSGEPWGTGFPLMRNRTNAESDAGSVSHSSGIELQMPSVSPVRPCPWDIVCLDYTSRESKPPSLI